MQFCLGVIPQLATGCHPNSFEAFFLSQMYTFLSKHYVYQKKKKKNLNLETQTFPTICILSRL